MLVFGLAYHCLSPFPPFKWIIRVTIYHILRYCKHIFHLCMILTSFQELFESPRRAGLQASGHQTSFMCHVFHDSKQFVWCWNYTFGLFSFLHINLWLMILSRTCPILGFHGSVRLRFDTWCLAHSVSRLKVLLWEGWQEGDFLHFCECPKNIQT